MRSTNENRFVCFSEPTFSVECDDEKMTIYILKDEISIPEGDLSKYNISWNDPDCGPSEKSNDTHLILVAGYSSCGTQAIDDGKIVIFENKVFFFSCSGRIHFCSIFLISTFSTD